MTELSGDVRFALALADIADAITLPLYESREFGLEWKANSTEVTEADRGAESAMAARIVAERPGDGVFGEEHGAGGSADATRRWVLDPIDGTSNFVRGIPVWATLIALVDVAAGPVVAAVSAPAMGTRWWASRGQGAFVQRGSRPPQRITVSPVAEIAEAQVCVTFSAGWDALGRTARLVELQQRARRARGFGDFWQHMLVAEGAVDVAVDAVGVAPYDLAAPMAIVEEAGGTFTDRLGVATFEHDTAVSSNGRLHELVLDLLR